ncbi:MAG: adenine deaminase C-terminal domain-containing protein [Aphanizomenon gracile PMC638.10]|nr:adenine deaminase C-terminal domain-containing protein [Aphanizomenon gracile PMC638.10]
MALVQNFGLKRGAIASSVAHDSITLWQWGQAMRKSVQR